MTAAITTRVVRDDAGFAALRERWDRLLPRCADANAFLSFAWLNSWWTAYRPAAGLRLALAEADGELLGVAPMVVTRGRWGLGARVLRFVGDGTYETDHMHFLADAARRAEVVEALLGALDGLDWDVAEFGQLPSDAADTPQILDWCRRRGFMVTESSQPCPIRDLPGSYEDLLASMQARFRTTLRSTRRKLQEKYRMEFGEYGRDGSPSALEEDLETLYRNHASRWSSKGQAGVFGDARKREFYRALSRELAGLGWLRFFHLKLDGKVVAQEYCFEYPPAGTVYLLQEGFDYAHAGDNVGNALRGLVFERLIGEGKRAYDFLAGTSRHKDLWSNRSVPDLRVTAARRNPRGAVHHHLPRLKEALGRRLGRGPRPGAGPQPREGRDAGAEAKA